MAEFRGTVQGNRGEASRLGHKSSGLTTECNTWNFGVRCRAVYNEFTERNEIVVFSTSGSGYGSSDEVIAIVASDEVRHVCKE